MVLRVIRHPRPQSGSPSLRTALVALLSTLTLLMPVVGVAHADTSDDIYSDFRKTGKIDPCKYTAKELGDAKDGIGSDANQYAPEYPDALDTAIAASGDCKSASSGASSSSGSSGGGTSSSSGRSTPAAPSTPAPATTSSAAPTPTTTAVVTPTPTTPAPAAVVQPSPAAKDGVITARAETPIDNGPEGWTWAILVAAILAAAALGWALVNATGRIQFLAPLGHSMGEAGWRIGLRWAEFRDWMRFGSGR